MEDFKYKLVAQHKFGSLWVTVVDISEILKPYCPINLREFTIKGESRDKHESFQIAIKKAKSQYLEFKNNVDQIK